MRTFTRKLFNKEETLNELFDRLTMAAGLSHRSLDAGGLSFPFGVGTFFLYDAWVDIPAGSLVVSASSTNYVELSITNPFGITANTTGFTPGRVPLFEVDTNGSGVTAVRDRRQLINLGQPGGETTQKIAFATPITPSFYGGRYIEVGELTGPMTINAPTLSPATDGSDSGNGSELIFMFKQDGLGPHALTWNSIYKKEADGTAAINTSGVTRFIYDRGNWIQYGGPLVWHA